MLAEDIVLQLAKKLPTFSDYFTSNYTVTGVSKIQIGSTTEVTVETNIPHNLAIGKGVNIMGAVTPINIASFTRVGTIGTITTTTDHDFTYSVVNGAISGSGAKIAEVLNANEAEFEGSFLITNVPNRRTLLVEMVDSGPSAATGSLTLENGSSILQQYNGIFSVTSVPSTTSFTYTINSTGLNTPNYTNMHVKANARISSAIDLETIIAAYTKQPVNDLWAFVVLEDALASKNRQIKSDATDNIQRSNYFRQQIIQPVSIYVVFPTASLQIAGRQSRDLAQKMFRPICQSILFKHFDSLLYSNTANTLNFLSHGFAYYNNAFYIHQYTFEQVADIQFEDTVGYDDDVALRDINLNMAVDTGTQLNKLTATIDLDEVF
ncbi:MAG: hypothetical protein OQL19_04030 [Gammaproteobacteria bacterium]|nr:hypothetical protein [Gammaproteobacteria bacterium]